MGEKLSKKFTEVSRTGHNVEFSHVGATQFNEASILMPTETGLPVVSSTSIPVVYSVKGSLKMSKIQGNQAPSVTAKVMPVVSGKMNVIYSVVSPFTGEIIGSGVDMSLHAATPVEVEGKMSVVRSSSLSGCHRRFRGLAVRSLLFMPLSCHSPSRRTSTRSFQSPPLPR